MVYTYTPAYYSSFQDSITSLCKSILPFSFKKHGLPAADHKLSKQQTDFLKWQQESFHHILNLMGLHKEGILPESEVSEFKCQLLETIFASKGTEHEQPVILRDKLLFLQELLYAKCISDEEYQAASRRLLQRLAVQGAQIDARNDVIPRSADKKESFDEEWSVIDLKDELCLINKDKDKNNGSKNKFKPAIKNIKGAAAKALGFGGSSQKQETNRAEKSIFDHLGSNGTPHRNPIEGHETGSVMESSEKVKRKGFLDKDEINGGKKHWEFKMWNRGNSEEETAPLPLNSNLGEGPDTKQIKKKLHSDGSASDFFIDKVGGNIKKELARIQAELSSTNTNLQFLNDEMETISTKLPADKTDLQKFFPKSWCDRNGEVVLDIVKKEFKGHVREMESTLQTRRNSLNTKRWATFDDDDVDENSHPNLFSHPKHHERTNNPFLHLEDDNAVNDRNKIGNQSFSNLFWNSSTLGS